VENFIDYFGLNKDPGDASYQSRKRQSLCHIINSVMHLLKRSKPVNEIDSISDSREHPTFLHILPVVVKLCIPMLR
jgi:hypothetical protein